MLNRRRDTPRRHFFDPHFPLPMTLTYDRALKGTIALIAVGMSVYHLWAALTGAPEPFYFRGAHLLFAMALVFLIYPGFVVRDETAEVALRDDAGGLLGAPPARVSWIEWLLILASAATIIYIWVEHERIITRYVFVEDPTTLEFCLGAAFTLLVLEATRRVLGWALPLTAIIFVAYGFLVAGVAPGQMV